MCEWVELDGRCPEYAALYRGFATGERTDAEDELGEVKRLADVVVCGTPRQGGFDETRIDDSVALNVGLGSVMDALFGPIEVVAGR